MKVTREVTTGIYASDGKAVNKGDVVMFSTGGRPVTASYEGVDSKGNWKFKGVGRFDKIGFTVAPRAIVEMVHALVRFPYEDLQEEK